MRTFFGLELDPHSKLALESWREKALPGLSGEVAPANYHITLAFLGNIQAADIESLSNIKLPPCKLDLCASEVGYFSKPGIGFLAVSATPELLTLRETLLAGIPMALRKKEQHSFVPHITLFRNLKQPLPAPLLQPDFTFSFTQLHLFESVQMQQKTAYKAIHTYC